MRRTSRLPARDVRSAARPERWLHRCSSRRRGDRDAHAPRSLLHPVGTTALKADTRLGLTSPREAARRLEVRASVPSRPPREVIDNIQRAEASTVGERVDHEVHRPALTGPTELEARFAIKPMHALVIRDDAFARHERVQPTVAVPPVVRPHVPGDVRSSAPLSLRA